MRRPISRHNPDASFQELLAKADSLHEEGRRISKELDTYPRGVMGLVADEHKDARWHELRREYEKSFQKLRAVNRILTTRYKKELAAARRRRNPTRHAGEHRIYVANLAAYNAGKLRGKWITPSTDVEELREQVLEAIGGNPDHEWAFHDYDAFPNMGENPNLDDVAAMAEILEEHPYAVVKAAMDFVGDDVDALKEWLDEGYGIYESEKDYVEQYVDEAGGPSALGKDAINSYFDYDAFGHDFLIDADEEDREQYEGLSDEEVGMQYIDNVYGDKIPKDLVDRYFDFDAYARDVFLEVASKYIRGEGLVVFHHAR